MCDCRQVSVEDITLAVDEVLSFTGKEPEKQMHSGLGVDFDVRLESRGSGTWDPAFRCGLSFRGDGRPIRDAGPCALPLAWMVAGSPVEVNWAPDVSWRKRIRVSNR